MGRPPLTYSFKISPKLLIYTHAHSLSWVHSPIRSCTFTHTHTLIHNHTFPHPFTHSHTKLLMHIHLLSHIHAYSHLHPHFYTLTHIHALTNVFTYAHMLTLRYSHAHTCIHTVLIFLILFGFTFLNNPYYQLTFN